MYFFLTTDTERTRVHPHIFRIEKREHTGTGLGSIGK